MSYMYYKLMTPLLIDKRVRMYMSKEMRFLHVNLLHEELKLPKTMDLTRSLL